MIFQSKHHKLFWNTDVVEKLEKLTKDEKKALNEQGIYTLPELLVRVGVRPIEVCTVMIGRYTIKNREEIHRLFDPMAPKREELQRKLREAKYQRRLLENQPLDKPNILTIRAINGEIIAWSDSIISLQSELDSIPKRNGITDRLFDYPDVWKLYKRGLVNTEGGKEERWFLTEKGKKAWQRSEDLLAMLRTRVASKTDRPTHDLALELWAEMKRLVR